MQIMFLVNLILLHRDWPPEIHQQQAVLIMWKFMALITHRIIYGLLMNITIEYYGLKFLVIPVELVSFTATVISNRVELNWLTATEKNNAGFAVEKNTNSAWSQIGYVKGNGTTTEQNSYSFTETTSAGKYQYRLKQMDYDGRFEYSNVVEVTVGLTPEDYKLSQNFPNPFNPSTTITFAMKNTEHVTVTVHNMLGEEVQRLFDGIANADEVYRLSFDAKNLSSGVYFYQLNSASKNEVKKMSLMK